MLNLFLVSLPFCFGFLWLAVTVSDMWREKDMERDLGRAYGRRVICQEDGVALMYLEGYEMPVRGRGHSERV